MTEKIVGAQYRVVIANDDVWYEGEIITLMENDDDSIIAYFTDGANNHHMFMDEVELITETVPQSSQTVDQSLNTLIKQYGMATVTAGIEQWMKFHSEEQ